MIRISGIRGMRFGLLSVTRVCEFESERIKPDSYGVDKQSALFMRILCHSIGTTSLQCVIFLFSSKNVVIYSYAIYIWCFCN